MLIVFFDVFKYVKRIYYYIDIRSLYCHVAYVISRSLEKLTEMGTSWGVARQ